MYRNRAVTVETFYQSIQEKRQKKRKKTKLLRNQISLSLLPPIVPLTHTSFTLMLHNAFKAGRFTWYTVDEQDEVKEKEF